MNAFRMVPVKGNKNRDDGLGADRGEKTEKVNSFLMKMGGNFVAYKYFHTVNRAKRGIRVKVRLGST